MAVGIKAPAAFSSETVDSLYTLPSVRLRAKALAEIQVEYNKIEAEFLKEKAALEAKYQKLYQPLFDKRYEIVNGLVEVEGVPNKDSEAEDDADKGIPDFWLKAMKNNEVVAAEIFEKDEEALGYLNDIKWSKLENRKGFKLDFCFDANNYFTNSVLTKIYHMIDEEDATLDKAIGTEIEWYPGKCLALNIDKEASISCKIKDHISFFDFFTPPPVPACRLDINDVIAEKLKKLTEQDYDVGTTIRDAIMPRAISWYNGEAYGDTYNPDEDDEDDSDSDEECVDGDF